MAAASGGHTNIAIALLKAKADINAKDMVRVGLAGWMVVSVQRLSTISGVECAGAKVEMSRACCCSVSHADAISPITTIQYGMDAIWYAKRRNYHETVSVLEQVVSE